MKKINVKDQSENGNIQVKVKMYSGDGVVYVAAERVRAVESLGLATRTR